MNRVLLMNHLTRHTSQYKLLMALSLSSVLAACQSTPVSVSNPKAAPNINKTPSAPAQDNVYNGARRTPLPSAAQPPIQVSPLPSINNQVSPGYKPVQPNVALRDGSNIPVFRVLINKAQQQLQANQLNEAEQTLIQAQRMAPQSTAVYAYLSEVAIKKRQGSNAEAMARKGLMLTNNPRQQSAFWQLILVAAQIQNNPALIAQARENIQALTSRF
jgi:hypothetical protein